MYSLVLVGAKLCLQPTAWFLGRMLKARIWVQTRKLRFWAVSQGHEVSAAGRFLLSDVHPEPFQQPAGIRGYLRAPKVM